MDDKDRLLLTLLRRNARASIVGLARDLGLSRSATQDRLAKLESSGAIAGYTIVEGAKVHSRQPAYLLVTLRQGARCAQVVPKIKRLPRVVLIHSLAGQIDLLIRIDASDVAEVETTRSAVAAFDEIVEVKTSIVLERYLG